jgi:hypothetical protein
MLTITANPLLNPARVPSNVEAELKVKPHLAADRRFIRREHRADLRDARQARGAAEAIGRLPGPDEAAHVVISGKFALWDMVPAVVTMAGANVAELHIATLGFSRRNIEKMAAMVDTGIINKVTLLASHYFSKTSATIYDFAVEEFGKRGRMRFLSVRTHAKILCIALVDGRKVTIESSANLRSCKNIEQATLFGSPDLYAFHLAWIDSLFAKGA